HCRPGAEEAHAGERAHVPGGAPALQDRSEDQTEEKRSRGVDREGRPGEGPSCGKGATYLIARQCACESARCDRYKYSRVSAVEADCRRAVGGTGCRGIIRREIRVDRQPVVATENATQT